MGLLSVIVIMGGILRSFNTKNMKKKYQYIILATVILHIIINLIFKNLINDGSNFHEIIFYIFTILILSTQNITTYLTNDISFKKIFFIEFKRIIIIVIYIIFIYYLF